jgi:hypothetical protein
MRTASLATHIPLAPSCLAGDPPPPIGRWKNSLTPPPLGCPYYNCVPQKFISRKHVEAVARQLREGARVPPATASGNASPAKQGK